MMEDADVNIVGTVISQTIEARGEDNTLYFTHSYVEGNNGELYDVLQTGAVIGGKEMNIPYDVSLLEIGQEYFLSLVQSAPSSLYDQYYLIAGGTQGIGEYEPTSNMVSAISLDSRALFKNMTINLMIDTIDVLEIKYPIIEYANDDTNYDPYSVIWIGQTDFNYYISSSIRTNYGSSTFNSICDGADSWNGGSSVTLDLVSRSMSADIKVYMSNFGETWWTGLTTYELSGEIDEIDREGLSEARVNLNEDKHAASELSYWQATTCHEVGHCLAMTHSNITGEIMYQDLETELENGSSIISPSYGDFQKLSVLYG